MKLVWTILVALGPSVGAIAQPVFFDDFDGDALLPHWNQPPPSHWEYNVSNSMLNVTGLFYPGLPPVNGTGIFADFEPQADFRVDVWMGWEGGAGMGLVMLGPEGQGIAGVAYVDGSFVLAFVGQGEFVGGLPLPIDGVRQFTITRVGGRFEFYHEGDLFGSIVVNPGPPAQRVSLGFQDWLSGGAVFHVDRVQIVPAPASASLLTVAAIGCSWRRKRAELSGVPRSVLSETQGQ